MFESDHRDPKKVNDRNSHPINENKLTLQGEVLGAKTMIDSIMWIVVKLQCIFGYKVDTVVFN